MKIVFLDGYTTSPGDIDDSCLQLLGNYQMYDRTTLDQLEERAADAEVLITNKFVIDHNSLAKLPRVQYIVVAATGYNNIDIKAVRERGIKVSNVRSYSTSSVVQQAFASLLSVLNRPTHYFEAVRKSRWENSNDFCFYDHSIREVSGLTLGIIGPGQIGKKMAELGHAFGMNVLLYSRSGVSLPFAETSHLLPHVLASADVVSLHVPLSDDTREMINADSLALMKNNAILINTGRGALIREKELADHLKSHPAFTAILDVLTSEPPQAHHPLIALPNCYITPHIAWASAKARQNLVNGIAQNIEAYFRGEWINAIY
ncbi:MAG: D-2-hydroxyacid dehydrogenase [Saprospiraceae bacterium]|jgi:glycerate dehydrogenase|nr:D-2-hydroxyacid dehydrogenase [Saprospiraceae bacterium]